MFYFLKVKIVVFNLFRKKFVVDFRVFFSIGSLLVNNYQECYKEFEQYRGEDFYQMLV